MSSSITRFLIPINPDSREDRSRSRTIVRFISRLEAQLRNIIIDARGFCGVASPEQDSDVPVMSRCPGNKPDQSPILIK
jgi:hypothetical protein